MTGIGARHPDVAQFEGDGVTGRRRRHVSPDGSEHTISEPAIRCPRRFGGAQLISARERYEAETPDKWDFWKLPARRGSPAGRIFRFRPDARPWRARRRTSHGDFFAHVSRRSPQQIARSMTTGTPRGATGGRSSPARRTSTDLSHGSFLAP